MYKLPPLRLDRKSYEEMFTAELFSLHYEKHHQGYVNKLNEFIKDTPYEQLSLDDIITATHDRSDALKVKIFNNAAQIFNHNFFWDSVTPQGSPLDPAVFSGVLKAYGTHESFKAEFKKAALDVFGSGWVWLVLDPSDDNGLIKIITTPNGDIPFGCSLVLVCDVWEHAYYPKFKNDRASYIDAYLDIMNWDFAFSNIKNPICFNKL